MDEIKEITVIIKRQDSPKSHSYTQTFKYNGDMHIPVTTLLEKINNHDKTITPRDEIQPVTWTCSCLQGLCGACTMLINGWPKLACKTFIDEELIPKYYEKIRIEPLTKFPVIKDLKVDRSKLYNTMKDTTQWLETEAKINIEDVPFEYEMSQCLMCGMCLEACPNYNPENEFPGAPIAVSTSKIIEQEQDKKHVKKLQKEYKNKFYNGCVKALVCRDVCPMKIPTQEAISRMNRKSVWHIWQAYDKLKK